MFRWNPFAMVRITAFFIAGILLGVHCPDSIPIDYLTTGFGVAVSAYFACSMLISRHSSVRWMMGLIGLGAMVLAGYLDALIKTDARQPTDLTQFGNPIDFYNADVMSLPEEKKNSWKIDINCTQVKSGNRWYVTSGKCILYVPKKNGPLDFQFGNQVLVKGTPHPVSAPGNPGEFDFKTFLKYKNISLQQVLDKASLRKVETSRSRGIVFYSQRVRAWASAKIKRHVAGEQQQVIARALVLGVTDGLDNDLQGAYAASGAMHILSVSGLHVGIIYGMILFLLKPLHQQSWSKWLVAIVSLSCLWAYAFVTGLSPSVLRSVAMFSFVAIGSPFARSTNLYNTLAASAFLLLMYDPYLIMSVGFQLSYLAVLGITYLYRPLYTSWEASSWLLDKIWQIICVSLAAQIATMALGLYYFHQFPVYFLLSNLIVVPLSSLVLVLGVVLLVMPVPVAAEFVGNLVSLSISGLNKVVFGVEGLPFSLVEGVRITAIQCWLLMAIIVSLLLLVEFRKIRFVVSSFILVVGFSGFQWKTLVEDQKLERWVIYKVPGHCALDWIGQGKSRFCADSSLLRDTEAIGYHIEPYRLMSGVGKGHTSLFNSGDVRSFSGCRLLWWRDLKVLWIDNRKHQLPRHLDVDWIVIGNDSVRSLDELDKVAFRQLILDSSNSEAYDLRVTAQGATKSISVYSVIHQGAFVVNR